MTHPRDAADCLLGNTTHRAHGGCPGVIGGHHTVMQTRCVFCKRDYPIAAIAAISYGDVGCPRCGRMPPVFATEADYLGALAAPGLAAWPFPAGDGPPTPGQPS